jgi:hypothetical protein
MGLILGLSLVGCNTPIIRNPLFRIRSSTGFPEPQAPVRPPLGVIYSNTRAPMSIAWDKTPVGGKEGQSAAYSVGVPILFGGSLRVAWGDGSIDTAQANGGLSKVNYTEYTSWSILSVFTKTTTHVYGE